jgi:uncharacterized membrane protein YeaQ/YmgE (transglycosylase-associated protein family)
MSAGHVISWLVCGLIVGLIARILVPGWHHFGLLKTMVLGIIGSFVGGLLFWMLWGAPGDPFSLSGNAWHGWIMAILGAVLVLWGYGALNRRTWWQW